MRHKDLQPSRAAGRENEFSIKQGNRVKEIK